MNKIIVQSARLHCAVERAFAMFTENEHLQAWLTRCADIEPVVGGRYELFWDPDDPEHNSTLGCKITAIEPDTLLAFEWKGPAQMRFMNEVDPLTHVAVLDRKSTRLNSSHQIISYAVFCLKKKNT